MLTSAKIILLENASFFSFFDVLPLLISSFFAFREYDKITVAFFRRVDYTALVSIGRRPSRKANFFPREDDIFR